MPIYTKIRRGNKKVFVLRYKKYEKNLNFYALSCNLQLTNTAILTIV